MEESKICPMCAESVKTTAKLCPFCRSDFRKGTIRVNLSPWFGSLILLLFFIGALVVFWRVVYPGKDFASCRDQVGISNSSIQFSGSEKGRYVTTLGTITNGSDYGWKDIQLEVRYFNQDGKLVDVGVQSFPEVVVQPHSESAFRIRTIADQSESEYKSYKVLVRTAKDVRRWP